jgi:hypothetical protein
MNGCGNSYTLQKAVELNGIAPVKLKRQILTSKVAEVARNLNNWRTFSKDDVRRIRQFADKKVPPRTNSK